MEKKVVAVVEDNLDALKEITEMLEFQGFRAIAANSAEKLFEAIEGVKVNVFLVDLGLPDINGFDLIRRLKSTMDSGIIVLSGRFEETDKVLALEIGADDYVEKPFMPRELVARINSVSRRVVEDVSIPVNPVDTDDAPNLDEVQKIGSMSLDHKSRTLTEHSGVEIPLTRSEFDLLAIFAARPHRVLSRDTVISLLKGHDFHGFDRAIDGLVSRVRKKLQQGDKSKIFIKTVHGVGYMFIPD